MCRLDTRAEVLQDLDAEWEVADDVIVTGAEPRSLLHHPRPTTRQLYLVVLSECLTGLYTALGSLSGLLHPGLGHWSHSLDEAGGTNELTSTSRSCSAVVDGTRGFCPGTLNCRGVRIG